MEALASVPRVADTFRLLERNYRPDRIQVVHKKIDSVQYDIDGPDGGTWSATVSGEHCTIKPGSLHRATVRVTLSSDEWLDLMRARIPSTDLAGTDKVQGAHYSDLMLLGLLGPIDSLRDPRPDWLDRHRFGETERDWFVDLYLPGYKPDHRRFRSAEEASCLEVGLCGFMGVRTMAAAIGESRYRGTMRPVAAVVTMGWAGCFVACLAPVVFVIAWASGRLPSLGPMPAWVPAVLLALTLIASVAAWHLAARTSLKLLRARALDDPDFYAFGLVRGLFTIASTPD